MVLQRSSLQAADLTRYNDGGPNVELCVNAQKYYKQYGYKTKTLAAGLLNIEEAKKLAGVSHMTIAIDLLHTLSKTEENSEDARAMSLFNDAEASEQEIEQMSFIENESKYAKAFDKSYKGKGKWKTKQVGLSQLVCISWVALLTSVNRQLTYFATTRTKL